MSFIKRAVKWVNKTTKSKAGFTLVEMLAAVGVAGVLGGIITPAAINSLAKARQAKCAANLRQFGNALVQHVTDTGVFPASALSLSGAGGEVRVRWFNALSPYMGADERARTNAQGSTGGANNLGDIDQTLFSRAMICPEVEGEWKIGRNNSYGYNFQYLGNARSTKSQISTGIDGTGAKRNGKVNYPVRLQDLNDPSRTVAIMDTDGTGQIGPYRDPLTMLGSENNPGGDYNFQTAAVEAYTAGIETSKSSTLGNEGYQVDPTFLPAWNFTGDPTDAVFDAPDDIPGAAAGSDRHYLGARGIASNRHDGGSNQGHLMKNFY